VKERGGLTIAQDPEEAEYPGMPRSAIETGMIDWVLQIASMPSRLIEYRDNGAKIALPSENGPQPMLVPRADADESEAALREVLIFLRTRTGRDFSYYKRATILRRIGRRMQVNSVADLREYLNFMRTHPSEPGALLQDLLISVTNFFRDGEAFEAVERYIPDLFQNKSQSDSVRVWVPACATGEEAYSFAMMLLEHARTLDNPPALQVFACDLDEDAIRVARMGHYPDAITADVSEERLKRFFVKDHRGYRVRRELREMVLFAAHDLLKDAPFSRMDLISCRNLLIYLNRHAQQRVLDTFHFALRPGGRLFLGSSETVEDDNRMFRVLDKKHRIYEPNAIHRIGLPVPVGSSALLRVVEALERQEVPVVHGKRFVHEAAVPFHHQFAERLDQQALAGLHFKLLERVGPPSLIINADQEILHLSERAGHFLRMVGGEPTMNLLRVIHPDLRTELRAALFRATESKIETETSSVSIKVNDEVRAVTMRVVPADDIAPGFLLIAFEEGGRSTTATTDHGDATSAPADPAIEQIERELEKVKRNLRDTVEQYEASTEELKASNEELQAMNEELRSATEELETSREELQSINEELTTVNQEMKGKMDELAHANSDLQNLMASTSIATIFLDRDLAITRYTPTAVELFHLIPTDVGRPLADLAHRVHYPELITDAEEVLRTLTPAEREVRDESRWFLARLQPYRTLDDHIAGLVLTFVDVSERKQATEASRISEERLRIVVESAKEYAIFTFDRERRIDSWYSGAEMMFGYTENEILGQLADILFIPEDRAKGDPEREARLARDEGRAENERWHIRKDGSTFYGSGAVMPIRDKQGGLLGYVKIMRDLTDSKRAQDAMSEQMDELTRFNTAAVGREVRMIDLKKEINELCQKLGESPRYKIQAEKDGGE
jgi:two-component system CheB/CheR fusion protein